MGSNSYTIPQDVKEKRQDSTQAGGAAACFLQNKKDSPGTLWVPSGKSWHPLSAKCE